MAIHKLQVFLASRFDEFETLRTRLKERINNVRVPEVEVIDLNDNAAHCEPPLSRCYEGVDRAELVLLLVGREYGSNAVNHEYSYTHLEYKRALDESKMILPFLIGPSHRREFNQEDYSDKLLGQWVADIRDHQTPKYLDASDDSELANQIFDEVHDRLVELFIKVDEGDVENSGETDDISEDTPIEMEQLASSPAILLDQPRSEQPLRILAANHSKEALRALKMGLPTVAIQQLKKAVELVPLDVVSSYWLSRLLVATGRKKQCAEGLRIALLAAKVASEEDESQKKRLMACYILAARANERLGELDVALDYAERAHEKMPGHWMAKLEYGRQLVFAGEKTAALERVEEAFWLRPDSLRRVHRDVAYRDLTRDLDRFRAGLRENVRREADKIVRAESRIQDLAQTMGITEETDELSESTLTSKIEQSAQQWALSEIHLVTKNDLIRTPREDHRTILQLLNTGRVAAKGSFWMLQQCAKKISADAVSFAFEGVRGLNPEIRNRLEEKIESAKTTVSDLSLREDRASKRVKQSEEEESKLLLMAACVGGVLLLTLGIGLFAGSLETAVIAIVLLLAGIGVGWYRYQTLKNKKSRAIEAFRALHQQLSKARSAWAALEDTLRLFESTDSIVRSNIATFCELAGEFEKVGLRRVTLSPVPPMDRPGVHDIVRVYPKKAADSGLAVDDALLPIELRFLGGTYAATSRYWIGRHVRFEETDMLSRSA